MKIPNMLSLSCAGLLALAAGCLSPSEHRRDLDRAAYHNVHEAQREALGRTTDFRVETPADTLRRRLLLDQELPLSGKASLGARSAPRIERWPDADYAPPAPATEPATNRPPPRLTLLQALEVAAANSPEYQGEKEAVFLAALNLDLERESFREKWLGKLSAGLSTDGSGERVSGLENRGRSGVNRALRRGGEFALELGVDLAKLLTGDKSSSLGLLADATLSIPLLRGAGRFVVEEPLTQAQRNTVYAIQRFERFKVTFAVAVASEYLGVQERLDQVENARENHARLKISSRRARRLADAGRLPEIQVDQAIQDELRARNRWISARLSYAEALDRFKIRLGLPPDAEIALSDEEIGRQTAAVAQRVEDESDPRTNDDVTDLRELEAASEAAIRTALRNRMDLRTRIGQVLDAQRGVAIAADRLRADLELLGRAAAGEGRSLSSAGQSDADFNVGDGRYSATLAFDAPWDRDTERHRYRASLIDFEQSVRSVQQLEDQIKNEVRTALRTLRESRQTVAIQAVALDVAVRRRDSATMFLEAGRAQMRDVLEAEEALISARNALTSAMVSYRTAQWRLQRDMGTLEIDTEGLERAFDPESSPENEE